MHRLWKFAVVPRVEVLRGPSRVRRALYGASTFAFVSLGWILFAAPSLPIAGRVFRELLL